MDEADPDLEDLREEFKPPMKQRLQGWIDTATTIPGGANTLLSVFKKTVDTLPFLLGNDIVEELLSRLSDKPNKHHVGDALEALHSFAKVQRKKFAASMEKKRRKDAAKNATNTSGSSASSSSVGFPPPPPLVAATFQTFGGIEDVD
ncbi:hypothetical protein EWM64_g5211 [Hericium alpestre]|uniref:Uncharacterized protein n=1 Tax=Hericium alpestre TaxID=135208 RepID=A0A4Y9ZV82_9AGAM|nr:hypothetical protein EWM64_g5211 [Hericium alpestre]